MSRRLRVVLGLVAAIVIAGALVAPVVLTGGSGPSASRCETKVLFDEHVYVRRPAPANAPLQKLAIGVGVLSGCGQPPANADVRSLAGVPRSQAIGLDDDTALYIRVGVCTGVARARLAACLASGA